MEEIPQDLALIEKYFDQFSPVQKEQIIALDKIYREWNEKINVISRKDINGLYEKHLLHSLGIAAIFEFQPGMEVIDIGTGGGFPGVPLAIFFPKTQFQLVDSIGKKLKVVEAVKSGIGLKNLTTRHIRAEEIKDRKFDVAVSRAVAPLKELWQWSRPLLRKYKEIPQNAADPLTQNRKDPNLPNGLICLKGGDLSKEISESNLKPRMIEISEIFQEAYFREKFLLYMPYTGR
jgi:16S rRNA (guanine527-N7)-methyltransferase